MGALEVFVLCIPVVACRIFLQPPSATRAIAAWFDIVVLVVSACQRHSLGYVQLPVASLRGSARATERRHPEVPAASVALDGAMPRRLPFRPLRGDEALSSAASLPRGRERLPGRGRCRSMLLPPDPRGRKGYARQDSRGNAPSSASGAWAHAVRGQRKMLAALGLILLPRARLLRRRSLCSLSGVRLRAVSDASRRSVPTLARGFGDGARMGRRLCGVGESRRVWRCLHRKREILCTSVGAFRVCGAGRSVSRHLFSTETWVFTCVTEPVNTHAPARVPLPTVDVETLEAVPGINAMGQASLSERPRAEGSRDNEGSLSATS